MLKEKKLCDNISFKGLTKKMQFENSRRGLELKICHKILFVLKFRKSQYYIVST